ncbi:MAG: hypothetical protein ACI4TK_05675, partial [Agathobacter sp.]
IAPEKVNTHDLRASFFFDRDKLIREQSASGQRKKQTTLLLASAHSSGLHTGFHQLNQVASG